MKKDDSIYLEHILQSIAKISGFIENLTFEDFRDKLIHQYMGVDLQSVWQVLIQDLPNFEKKVKTIIDLP